MSKKGSTLFAMLLSVSLLQACGGGSEGQAVPAETATVETGVADTDDDSSTEAAPTTEATVPDTTTTTETAADDTAVETTVADENEAEDTVNLPDNVIMLTDREVSAATLQRLIDDADQNQEARLSGDIDGQAVTLVKLSGKTNHFGRDEDLEYIDYHATVPDTRVWIAEHPETRDLNITTDDTGWWTMYVVKDAGVDQRFSFIFEKDEWITTKTNVNTIADLDDVDFAIQFIDPHFFQTAMVPLVEGMMHGEGLPDFSLENAMVVTVGKSWGSMHDDRLPHGDPGATVSLRVAEAAAADHIGPIYFNKDVIPDLTQPDVSVDGGVVWLNMAQEGTYHVTAEKPGVTYPEVEFTFTQADKDAGVILYIASPPDSLEGDNDSPPGEN